MSGLLHHPHLFSTKIRSFNTVVCCFCSTTFFHQRFHSSIYLEIKWVDTCYKIKHSFCLFWIIKMSTFKTILFFLHFTSLWKYNWELYIYIVEYCGQYYGWKYHYIRNSLVIIKLYLILKPRDSNSSWESRSCLCRILAYSYINIMK